MSCSPTSAAEISKRWRSLSRSDFTTIRFSLSDCAYSMCSSRSATATIIVLVGARSSAPAALECRARCRAPLRQRRLELLDLERFDDIADFDVLEPLDADAALE